MKPVDRRNEPHEGWKNYWSWHLWALLESSQNLVRKLAQMPSFATLDGAAIRKCLSAEGEITRHFNERELTLVDWDGIAVEWMAKVAEGCYDEFTSIERRVIENLAAVEVTSHGDVFHAVVPGKLPRPDYEAVDAVLRRLGGAWAKQAKAHVFSIDPRPHLEQVIATGNLRIKVDTNPHDYYPTPDQTAKNLVERFFMDLPEGASVLEPSIGDGVLARALFDARPDLQIEAWEIDERRAQAAQKDFDVIQGDFLEAQPAGYAYDAIFMNPPFANGDDARHVEHALKFLAPGGRLVAIMSAGVNYRKGERYEALRAAAAQSGHIEELPEGTFKDAGTNVRSVVFAYRSPAEPEVQHAPARGRP